MSFGSKLVFPEHFHYSQFFSSNRSILELQYPLFFLKNGSLAVLLELKLAENLQIWQKKIKVRLGLLKKKCGAIFAGNEEASQKHLLLNFSFVRPFRFCVRYKGNRNAGFLHLKKITVTLTKRTKKPVLRVFCVWRENHVEMSYFLIKYALYCG